MTRNKKIVSFEKKKKFYGLLFIAPWILGVLVFYLNPLITSIVYSLSRVSLTANGLDVKYNGLKNFVALFNDDPDFLRMLTSTLSSVVYQIPIIIIVSLFLAILLNKKFRGRLFFRVVFFLPVIIASGYIISVLTGNAVKDIAVGSKDMSAMFITESLGTVLNQLGLSTSIQQMLQSYTTNTLNLLWKSGVQVLLFLAGLQSVAPSLREVADIEGVTSWQFFWKITLPIISPVIILNVVYTVVDSFTDSSNEYMKKIYSLINSAEISTASAMAWIYFVIILMAIGVLFLIIGKRIFYLNK